MRENVIPLLNGAGELDTKGTEKAEVLHAFSQQSLVVRPDFSNPRSPRLLLSLKQGKRSLDEQELDIHMVLDWMHPQLHDVIARPFSVTLEKSQYTGEVSED